jgi:hypothetical protein
MKAINLTPVFTGLLLFFCGFNVQSQVTYGYDAAGNRISRTIIFGQLRNAQQKDQETTVYSEQLKDLKIRIYPNPTHGLLKVEILNMKEDQFATVFLYDLFGKLILSRDKILNSIELDISNNVSGTYILQIFAGESKTEWKIIKK